MMTGTGLIWLAVTAGALLCVGMVGLLAVIELMPRARGEEIPVAPRVVAPRPVPSLMTGEHLVQGPPAAPSSRARAAATTSSSDGGLRRAGALAVPKPPAPKAPAPKPTAVRAAPASPTRPPPAAHYNLDFEEDGEPQTVMAYRQSYMGDDEDLEDSPTVTVSRAELDGRMDFHLHDREN